MATAVHSSPSPLSEGEDRTPRDRSQPRLHGSAAEIRRGAEEEEGRVLMAKKQKQQVKLPLQTLL